MREEDIKKMIKVSAEHVTIPESLEPEQMMKRLRAMDESDSKQIDPKQIDPKQQVGGSSGTADRKQPRKLYRYLRYSSAAAAALLVVILITAEKYKMPVKPSDSGQITQETAAGPEAEQEAEDYPLLTDSEAASSYRANSYDEVYDRFQELRKEQEKYSYNDDSSGWRGIFGRWFGGGSDGNMTEETWAAEEAEAGASAGLSSADAAAPEAGYGEIKTKTIEQAADAYSDTNIQVEGVDEGDVVKTDGNYIYAASADLGTIRIIQPNGTELKVIGEIADSSTVTGARQIQEFYVNEDWITVIRSYYESNDVNQPAVSDSFDGAYYHSYMPGKAMTVIETYDLTERGAPQLSGSVTQDGYYKNSRRSGDYVYVFTGYDADVYAERKELLKYIPQVNGKIIPADCIYIPENLEAYSYLVISSVDMEKPDKPVQTKAVAASGEQYYVSGSNIYIASSKYDFRANQYDYTELMKLSYRDGRIGFASYGKVNGYLNNQFSMDEYQGKLRLVSTLSRNSGKTTNSLYILDETLEKIGEIEDLAPDEQIYSARFMGDTGYFVTFRNMDPLFSVDLSDPTKPKVLGELKITGFSEYLHPYMDGLLLGIGREINPETTNFEGLKLSMFDTSDPKNVLEVQKIVEESYEYSTAWENHKAVLISPTRNLIGFTVESYDYDKREWGLQYTVYSYDKQNGFRQKLSADLDEDGDYSMVRGLYINNWLYVVENNRINAYSLDDFSHGGKLSY